MDQNLENIYNIETRAARREKLGQRVFLARHRAGISQVEMANKLGCSRYKLYRVEKGIADFTVVEMEELAAMCGMTFDELVHLREYASYP